MKKSTRTALVVLCSAFFALFLISGYQVFSIMREYKAAETMYDKLNEQYVTTPAPATPKPSPSAAPQTTEEPEAEPDPLMPPTVNFEELSKDWPEVIGWLYNPGTVINYPLAQDPDDNENEKYLYTFLDGTHNGAGTIFADYRTPGDFSAYSTVLYGHHMKDGSMFASLIGYGEQDYYEEHPFMYLCTPEQTYRLDVFSAYVTGAEGSTYTYKFKSRDAFQAYLDKVTSWSYIETGVEVSADDRIVVMSTCTYDYDDARFVVISKLVPIDPADPFPENFLPPSPTPAPEEPPAPEAAESPAPET